MKKIYLITSKVTGPCGHGEPGAEYTALADDGVYTLGNLYPAFTTREAAEEYKADKTRENRSKITELELVG
jgi:hypothetical protein